MIKRGIVFITLLVILIFIRLRITEGFQGASGPSVVICKAEWCGHCKSAAPEFKKLLDASPITLANGTQATVKMLDADKDKEEIKQYNVRGYPTILITNNGTPTEYPGDRTYDGVLKFLHNM